MSYILEALKKAQAERQLGNAPTIHAPQPVQVNAAAGGAAANRKPLLLGLGAGALVVLVGALLMWRHGPAPDAAGSAPASPATVGTPAAGTATLAVRAPDTPAPVAPPVPRAAAPHPATPAQASASRMGAGARVAGAVAVPPVSVATGQSPVAVAVSQPPAAPASQRPAASPMPAAVHVAAPAAAPEDSLPLVQQLPEAVRGQLPRVSFGGYMYSANPADRLVLIDNVLRHEGEEVAPGLVLEKLMPKVVVMNFRGVRYRVAY